MRRRPGLPPPTPPGLSFRAAFPRALGPLALATELAKLAVARHGRCRVRPRRVASSSSQARAWPTPSSFTEEADFMRFSSLRAASARARPCCVFQNVACRRYLRATLPLLGTPRPAAESLRCRRVVASSKTHCLPVAQKSGVANSMKAQGSKLRVQSSEQIFSSPSPSLPRDSVCS